MSLCRRAFTLIELLVVIAIIAILAAILFPVFAQAKASAKQATCLSNSKQYNLATQMYLADFEDMSPLVQWTGSYDANPARSDRDQVVGNLVQPYMKNYAMFQSPSSPCGDRDRDLDLINPTSVTYRKEQYELNRAIKADYGQNTQYFSRMGYDTSYPNSFHPGGTGFSQVGSPATTLLYVNSVWDRSGGTPRGGGNWGLDMPCRWYSDGTDSLPPPPAGSTGYWWWGGWNPNSPLAWNVYGGVWPYHRTNLIAIVTFADGHSKGMRIPEISAGCDVRPGWQGFIFDREKYIWDLQ